MRITARRITVAITLLTAAFVLLPAAGLTQQTAWPWADGGGDGVTLLLFGDTNIQERQHPGDVFKNLLPTLRRDADNNPILLDPNTGAGAQMLKQLRELSGAGGAELTVRGKEVIVGGVGAELSRAAGR